MVRTYEPEFLEFEEELGRTESGLWGEDGSAYWELQNDSHYSPSLGEEEWEYTPSCPSPTPETVSGFSRYSNSLASLPRNEQSKVKNIANMIVRSFRPGCPIRTVRLVGHADRDLVRERREPGFMLRISRERALAVKQGLERFINNRAISSRIVWDVRGVGATQLVVPNPRTESERMRNRRVEIWLNAKDVEPNSPPYIRWAQSCCNKVLGTRLAVNGVMGPETRSAIRSFQQRKRLMVNGLLNAQTLAGLIATCGSPFISTVTTGWPDAPASGAATRQSNIHVPSTGWNRSVVGVSRIDRIPLDGLSTANPDDDKTSSAAESAKQRALVLKPYYLDQANTTIDVLLHLHGHNVGYRQRTQPSTANDGTVRDVDCDRMEQQLETWGFSAGSGSLRVRGERLIAVLAQGTTSSKFGTGPNKTIQDPNAYLREIFQALISHGVLPQNAQPGRTILSGHSGAGLPLSKMLESGNVPSNLSMVILFDAINDQTEFNRFKKWIQEQIRNDIRNLTGKTETDQLNYLSHSMRFLGYHSNEGSYQAAYVDLNIAIMEALKPPATFPLASKRVFDALKNNYSVVKVGGDHDCIVGNPTSIFGGGRPLEVALAQFPTP